MDMGVSPRALLHKPPAVGRRTILGRGSPLPRARSAGPSCGVTQQQGSLSCGESLPLAVLWGAGGGWDKVIDACMALLPLWSHFILSPSSVF